MKAELEVKHKDLLGRVGALHVGGKKVETPAFVPVINPVNQVVPPEEIRRRFGCGIVITNAYILYKRFRSKAVEEGVHRLIGFDGVVMTDSGGYQVLVYGDVEASPDDIAFFQESIGSDIAVPLDKPTGLVGRREAEKTVEETLANVRRTVELVGHDGRCVWVGPVQGGLYRDLVQKCVDEYKRLGFSLYCLGSPTPLMTAYRYRELVSMIATTRHVLGTVKPLHLFGAGHPMMFALAVALGVDMFDSASYALFAKEDRYILPEGTVRLEQLSHLPCSCEVCTRFSAKELRELEREERFRNLALHNLFVCFQEVEAIKQAIWEGRMYELLERKARSHPAVYEAFQHIFRDEETLQTMALHTPLSKRRGLFLFDTTSLQRPEYRRMTEWLRRWTPSCLEAAVLVSHRAVVNRRIEKLFEMLAKVVGDGCFEVFVHDTPYGLVPLSLYHVFPISQTTYPETLVKQLEDKIFREAAETLAKHDFKKIIIIETRRETYPGYSRKLAHSLQTSLSKEVVYTTSK
ncbi:MAG: tRNA guanosine(15) transglycosylase TgtA [Candidatus Caldarchaeum sp.]|nr:tRNA guanosine(15) transglycosylase TgtA [Candidatus Caldarchaeales archaeon]